MTSTNSHSQKQLIPLAANLPHRGMNFSKSTLLRAAQRGDITLVRFRLGGARKVRLLIDVATLDAWIDREIGREKMS